MGDSPPLVSRCDSRICRRLVQGADAAPCPGAQQRRERPADAAPDDKAPPPSLFAIYQVNWLRYTRRTGLGATTRGETGCQKPRNR